MPQSLAAVYVHIVFSTKGRTPILSTPSLREEVHAFLGGISGTMGCPPLLVGGTEDHIHLLGRQSRTVCLADWVKELKTRSTAWIKTHDRALSDFAWQQGYGAFSVSQSGIEDVRRYIRTQEEHHKKTSFQDELRTLLTEHEIEWDERYIWD